MKIDRITWLEEIFGHNVFRLDFPEDFEPATRQDLSQMDLFDLGDHERVFLYARVPTHRLDQLKALISIGFHLIEVNVTFARRQAEPSRHEEPGSLIIRKVSFEEGKPFLDIAASCFRYSRFHLDHRVSNEIANTIKRNWVESYLLSIRGDILFGGFEEGKPVGFLAAMTIPHKDASIGVIDLIGVDTDKQGQGVGQSLVEHFVDSYAGKCRSLRVGTQISNLPSIRLYERCGFITKETAFVLHCHLKNGKVLN